MIIYGDEAKWITTCADYILKSEFRLDKFHLMKSILETTRTISNNRKRLKSNILKCLYKNNKEMLIDLIDEAIGKLIGFKQQY